MTSPPAPAGHAPAPAFEPLGVAVRRLTRAEMVPETVAPPEATQPVHAPHKGQRLDIRV